MIYPVSTIDAYIFAIPEERREEVVTLIGMIKNAAPGLHESMEFKMPTFGFDSFLVAVAAQKNNLALYIKDTFLVEKYKQSLGKVSTGKTCIRFKKLSDLNLEILEQLLAEATAQNHK